MNMPCIALHLQLYLHPPYLQNGVVIFAANIECAIFAAPRNFQLDHFAATSSPLDLNLLGEQTKHLDMHMRCESFEDEGYLFDPEMYDFKAVSSGFINVTLIQE